jgi:hypothetical protein
MLKDHLFLFDLSPHVEMARALDFDQMIPSTRFSSFERRLFHFSSFVVISIVSFNLWHSDMLACHDDLIQFTSFFRSSQFLNKREDNLSRETQR